MFIAQQMERVLFQPNPAVWKIVQPTHNIFNVFLQKYFIIYILKVRDTSNILQNVPNIAICTSVTLIFNLLKLNEKLIFPHEITFFQPQSYALSNVFLFIFLVLKLF